MWGNVGWVVLLFTLDSKHLSYVFRITLGFVISKSSSGPPTPRNIVYATRFNELCLSVSNQTSLAGIVPDSRIAGDTCKGSD